MVSSSLSNALRKYSLGIHKGIVGPSLRSLVTKFLKEFSKEIP